MPRRPVIIECVRVHHDLGDVEEHQEQKQIDSSPEVSLLVILHEVDDLCDYHWVHGVGQKMVALPKKREHVVLPEGPNDRHEDVLVLLFCEDGLHFFDLILD